MKHNQILYIGNDLVKKTTYTTSMDTITRLMKEDGIRVLKASSKVPKGVRLLDMLKAVFTHRNAIDYLLIDTFSTSSFYFAFFTSQLSRILRIKYITILRGGNLPYRLEQSPILAALVFSHAYKNVAPSNYLKIAFEKRDFSSIYIPNILEIKNYIYKERTRIQPKILWVRAFKYLYNPSMAIAVLQLVKKEFPEAKLCMVGPQMDASFEASKNLTKQYGLEKSVVFTGVLEKEKWLHKATDYDVFINTTNFDNTPVSVMEAMALGLTIVSTDAGGMPYLIDDQVDGVLVGKDEHHKMAAAIIKLIKECNTSYAKKARIKAESFGWNVVREQWKSILV